MGITSLLRRLALLAAPLVLSAGSAGATIYHATDLGTLGGSYSFARGINDAGQVVGYAYPTYNGGIRGFLWQSGQPIQGLNTLGGTYSFAYGINDAGQVVGEAYTTYNATCHAFLWQNGGMQDLGTFGGTYSGASGINDAGQVVGYANTTGGLTHAFLWQSGSMQDLGTLGELTATPTASTMLDRWWGRPTLRAALRTPSCGRAGAYRT